MAMTILEEGWEPDEQPEDDTGEHSGYPECNEFPSSYLKVAGCLPDGGVFAVHRQEQDVGGAVKGLACRRRLQRATITCKRMCVCMCVWGEVCVYCLGKDAGMTSWQELPPRASCMRGA